jgi:hypothetical protein
VITYYHVASQDDRVENRLIAMEQLSELSVRAFHCNKMAIIPLVLLPQIKMSFKYGVCPDTSQALTEYGLLVLCGLLWSYGG